MARDEPGLDYNDNTFHNMLQGLYASFLLAQSADTFSYIKAGSQGISV